MEKLLTKEEVREIINKKYIREGFFNRHFGSTTYKEYEKIENSKLRNKQQTNGLKIYLNKSSYIILLVSSIFFLATFSYFNLGKLTSFFLKLTYCISFLCILISTYKIFFSKTLYIEILPNSFKLNEREIFWNEILITGILRVNGKVSYNILILGLSTGEILKLNIDKSDIRTRSFVQIIHLNKN